MASINKKRTISFVDAINESLHLEMKRNKNFSQEILKLIKKNKDILDNPQELYNALNNLGFEMLKNLKKSILHDSK